MNYSDFPILTSLEYENLFKAYNQIKGNLTPTSNSSVIYNKLYESLKSFSTIKNQFNLNIKNELNKHLTIIQQLLENLNSFFKVEKIKSTEVKEFNLFSYFKNLVHVLEITNTWLKNEDKASIKQFLHNLNNSIIYMLNNIFDCLEKSNIILFKYM